MTTQDSHALIVTHLPDVRNMAARLKTILPAQIEADELAAEGALGLVEAAITFDEKRGTKFRTWAYPRVRGRMLDHVRSEARRQGDVPLDHLGDNILEDDRARLVFMSDTMCDDADVANA